MCGLQVSVLLVGQDENIKLKGIPRRSFCSGFMNLIACTELCEVRNMIYRFLVQLHFKLLHSILCLGRPFKEQKEQVQLKKDRNNCPSEANLNAPLLQKVIFCWYTGLRFPETLTLQPFSMWGIGLRSFASRQVLRLIPVLFQHSTINFIQ